MRGKRAYVIEAKITNGDVKKCEFWSSAKKVGRFGELGS